MIYENKILEIARENNGIVTTKQITENKIARIYLTKLVQKKILNKIERGMYSTKSPKINHFYSKQNKSTKIIFSHFTALNLLGVYKNIEETEQVSVKQGYNAKNLKGYKIFYNHEKNYNHGLITINHEGHIIKIYDLERSVCDIIKSQNRFEEIEYNKFINFYFNRDDINYKKLLEYSILLNISNKVHHYLALFKA